jgi:uncharacterized protein
MTEIHRGFRIVSQPRFRHSAFCLLTSAFCILLSESCGPSSIGNRESKINNPAAPRPPLPTTELRIKSALVSAEVVSKPADRALGLMFRRSMAPDSGMLFVFDSDDYQRFWMKNTLIPLSIAYISRDSLITDILEMAPLDTTTPYLSSKAVRYALEMNSGWFQAKGIKPGDTVRGIPQK